MSFIMLLNIFLIQQYGSLVKIKHIRSIIVMVFIFSLLFYSTPDKETLGLRAICVPCPCIRIFLPTLRQAALQA